MIDPTIGETARMRSRIIRGYWTIMDEFVLNRVTVHDFGQVYEPILALSIDYFDFLLPGYSSKGIDCLFLHIAVDKMLARGDFEGGDISDLLFSKNLFVDVFKCEHVNEL